MLTTNALTAVDAVLVPVATEPMAERTIKLILSTIVDVRESELNATLAAWRILPSLYDGRLAHHREVLAALQAKYGALVYPEPVKSATKYKAVYPEIPAQAWHAIRAQFCGTVKMPCMLQTAIPHPAQTPMHVTYAPR